VDCLIMANWGFLTKPRRGADVHPHDPGARLRDIAARLDITERSAHGIITDLTAAGYLVKQKDGRRNRYQIQAHLPLREAGGDIGTPDVLTLSGIGVGSSADDVTRTYPGSITVRPAPTAPNAFWYVYTANPVFSSGTGTGAACLT
jgi:hypothetical protein